MSTIIVRPNPTVVERNHQASSANAQDDSDFQPNKIIPSSFNARLRDEFLNSHQFDSLLEAQVLLADWRQEYNLKRTHSALGRLTPAKFAEVWKCQREELLAQLVA